MSAIVLVDNEEDYESLLHSFKKIHYGQSHMKTPMMNLVTLSSSQMMIKFHPNAMDERSSLIRENQHPKNLTL